jgi:geranylgeranyl diphosphate synthase type II
MTASRKRATRRSPSSKTGGATRTAGGGVRSTSKHSGGLPAGLDRRRQVFERYLKRRLEKLDSIPPRLAEAIRYSVLGGGKRVRPLLVLLGCEAVAGRRAKALPAATAFELVHAFSLVHDDLPAMDDDDLRRGRATVHKQFDEATAILAGDALLAMAFEEMASLPRRGVEVAAALEATKLLASATGPRGMVAGQQLDMEAEGRRRRLSRSAVEEIHTRKTGALIAAALEVGAVVGGGDLAQRRRLRRCGEDLGLAFQIVDDLLDERSSSEQLGKSVGADRARGKATYPAAVGADEAERTARHLINRARSRIEIFGKRGEGLRQLADYLAERQV